MSLVAYHNDEDLKKRVVAEAIEHRLADQYITGEYWDEYQQKGCSVGCMLKSGNHALSEKIWGIPEEITRLQDCMFEGLSKDLRDTWTERYFAAIKPGADLSRVVYFFLGDILRNINLSDSTDPDVQASILLSRSSIVQCIEVMDIYASGLIDLEKRSAAKSAAWAAAWAAKSAESAAWAAESAAKSAAWAAESAAKSAAWAAAKSAESAAKSAESAAESAAWAAWAAESAAWAAESHMLIKRLEEAPMVEVRI